MAAAATKTLKIGTGVCLIAQRDPIQTAKLVASIDQVSGGRFVFGVGNGWNQDEMENHGTNFAIAPQAGARAHRGDEGDLDPGHRRVPRRVRRFRSDADLAEAGAEAASADPGGRRVSLQRAPRGALRRRLDAADHRGSPTPLTELIPRFRQMAAEAGRDPAQFDISIGGQAEDVDLIKRYQDLDVNRVSVSLPSEKADTILPVLDRWAAIIRAVNG